MMLVPTRRQWQRWSLPSKFTAVGLFISIFSIVIGVLFYLSDINKTDGTELIQREIAMLRSELKATKLGLNSLDEAYLRGLMSAIADIGIRKEVHIQSMLTEMNDGRNTLAKTQIATHTYADRLKVSSLSRLYSDNVDDWFLLEEATGLYFLKSEQKAHLPPVLKLLCTFERSKTKEEASCRFEPPPIDYAASSVWVELNLAGFVVKDRVPVGDMTQLELLETRTGITGIGFVEQVRAKVGNSVVKSNLALQTDR